MNQIDHETGEMPLGVPPMPPNVAKAIAAVMGEVPKLGKGEKNTHGNYNFASIDDFLEAVRPLCAKHGLIIVQDEDGFEMREGWLVIRFRFTLAHSSGETWAHRPARTIMVSSKMGAQAFGAAQSYCLKQFDRSLFQIATGEKTDDADTHPAGDLDAQDAANSKRKVGWSKNGQTRTPYSLRQEKVWEEFETELMEIQNLAGLQKFAMEWSAKAEADRWNQNWKDLAYEEINKRRETLKAELSIIDAG